MKLWSNVVFSALLAALAGCASGGGEGDKVTSSSQVVQREKEGGPWLSQQGEGVLVMTHLGSNRFCAGMPAMITVAVKNVGDGMVDIPGWHAEEADNLILYYIKCDAAGDIPPATTTADWSVQKPSGRAAGTYPVSLMPENSILLNAELAFVDKMSDPEEPLYYLVVAKLNNSKLQLATPAFKIQILPFKPQP